MEAIILAGGYGTRLRPLTFTHAKSLLPIMNKPMISYLINSLPQEVDTIIIAVNYRKKQIEEFFQFNDFGKEIIINDEPEPLGTGGAVKFAEQHITDEFFVLNSDVICSLNLSNMIDFHRKCNAISTISLWPVDNVSEFGVVDIEDNKQIVRFVEKPKPEDAPSNLINAGAYLLDPNILDYIPQGRLVSMEKEIFPQIIQDTHRFYGFQFEGYWMDIGRIQSYFNIHRFLLNRLKQSNLTGTDCSIQGNLSGSVLGDYVMVKNNARVIDSIIHDQVIIKENVSLKNCVIGEHAVIEAFSDLHDTVVGANEHIQAESKLQNQIIWTQDIPKGYPKKQIGNVVGE